MRKFYIKTGDKTHFLSLIKDYRKQGFNLVTLGDHFAELESEAEFIIINY